jgi:hypothetical protein
MTLVETGMDAVENHIGELALRRMRAGELSPEKSAGADRHLAACAACRSKLRVLVEEERAFQRDIPFERFAGGVDRARRVPRPSPRRAWMLGVSGVVAAAAIAVFMVRVSPSQRNRIKGAPVEATLRIAAADPSVQRSAPAGSHEVLVPGDRVRLGYRTDDTRFLAAVSVDDGGEVTPLYPESGAALAVSPTQAIEFLPDSIEFTGTGNERVFLYLARAPFDLAQAVQAVKSAHAQARGDLATLQSPAFAPGQQVFSWLLKKP